MATTFFPKGLCVALGLAALLIRQHAGAQPAIAFAEPRGTALPQNGGIPAIADLDGDGRLDAVVNHFGLGSISIVPLGPTGPGAARTIAAGVTGASSVALGDLNGDGRLDAAVSGLNSGTVSVLLGDGGGGLAGRREPLALARTLPAPGQPTGVKILDFDGDGILDIGVSLYQSNRIGILRGRSDGTFAPLEGYPCGRGPNALLSVDLDGDGRRELLTADFLEGTLSVLRAGATGAELLPSGGSGPTALTAGDFNSDGYADVVVVHQTSNDASLFLNDGRGGLGVIQRFPTLGTTPFHVVAFDADGDARPEIVVSHTGTPGLKVFGFPGGPTRPPVVVDVLAASGTLRGLGHADVNADRLEDIIIEVPISQLATSQSIGNWTCIRPKEPVFSFTESRGALVLRFESLVDGEIHEVEIDTSPDFPMPVILATRGPSLVVPPEIVQLLRRWLRVRKRKSCGSGPPVVRHVPISSFTPDATLFLDSFFDVFPEDTLSAGSVKVMNTGRVPVRGRLLLGATPSLFEIPGEPGFSLEPGDSVSKEVRFRGGAAGLYGARVGFELEGSLRDPCADVLLTGLHRATLSELLKNRSVRHTLTDLAGSGRPRRHRYGALIEPRPEVPEPLLLRGAGFTAGSEDLTSFVASPGSDPTTDILVCGAGRVTILPMRATFRFGGDSIDVIGSRLAAPAATPGFSFLVPTVVSGTSATGVALTTDGWLRNPLPGSASVELTYVPDGPEGDSGPGVLRRTLTVPAETTLRLADLVATHFGVTGSGLLEERGVSANALSLSALVEAMSEGRPATRFATEIPVVSPGAGVGASEGELLIPGIDDDGQSRANVILAETKGAAAAVDVVVRDASGREVGRTRLDMPPRGKRQINRIVDAVSRGTSISGGSVSLRVASGGGRVFALATVIDQASSSFAAVTGRALGSAPSEPLILPSAARLPGAFGSQFTTSLSLANGGDEVARLALSYHYVDVDAAGSRKTARAEVVLPPRGALAKNLGADALSTLFGVAARSYGWISVSGDTKNIAGAVAVSSLVDPAAPERGRKSASVAAVPASSTLLCARGGQERRFPGGERNETIRTNLVLVETAGASAEAVVRILTRRGAPLGARTFTLSPHEYLQITDVLSAFDLGQGALDDFEIAAGVASGEGRVLAFATRNDNLSGNPEIHVLKEPGPPAGE